MLVADQIFFADPNTFNDPLDTRPSLDLDLDGSSLEAILRMLVEQRINAEMLAAAKTIKYRGTKTINHIATHSRRLTGLQPMHLKPHAYKQHGYLTFSRPRPKSSSFAS